MQRRVLVACLALFVAVSGGLWFFAAWLDLRQTLEHGVMAAQATAQLMQANAARAIEAGDALSLSLRAEVDEWDFKDEAYGHHLLQQIRRQMAATPQVSSFWVIDPGGRNLIESWGYPPKSTANLSERSYFLAHRGKERGLAIEPVETGAISGQRRFTLSRAVRDGAGRLRAVVVVGILSSAFSRLFEDAGLGLKGQYCLVTLDGQVLARWPDNGDLQPSERLNGVLARLSAGSNGLLEQDSLTEGGGVLAALRVERLPIAVVTRVAGQELLGPWLRRTAYSGIATLAAVAGFGLLVLFGLRITRRDRQLRDQLEAANRELDRRVSESERCPAKELA
jgi:C4-dicarboxylate-specific signal transduction histidine kinase